jgi:predicted nucleic acid-binding Zn ribbon protein
VPLYDYQCRKCGYQIEYACPVAERPQSMPCDRPLGDGSDCKGEMRQIITAPAIQVDTAQDVPWLREFAETRPEARLNQRIGKEKMQTIETRGDYRRYLKEKDLRPADGPNLSEV